MPYITEKQKTYLNFKVNDPSPYLDANRSGELNYFISSLIWKLFDRRPSYDTANQLLGVLEAVKQEFYRRKVALYEEKKRQENGDININD